MKTRISSLILIIVAVLGCSKSSDPKASGGCSFTFKGTSYTLTVAPCAGQTSTIFGATSSNASQTIQLVKDYSSFNLDDISFSPNVSTGEIYSALGTGIKPSISITNGKWTFSGTLQDDNGLQGSISGTCSCK